MQDEASLLQQACNGDPVSFDLLLEPHMQRAYRVAYLITHDPHAASDALQEALIRAHRALGNLREGSPRLSCPCRSGHLPQIHLNGPCWTERRGNSFGS